MFPLWDLVIEPVIRASGGRRILEIGALRGETTVQMLDFLGPDSEVHVIDPLPEFDPSEHERRFAGRYVFHRDLSLNVLPDVPAFDVALIDGDHNWYTVYNELRLLAEASRRDQVLLPVLIMHDVGWPYGRRDLYYAPEQVPDQFRQPHAKAGMRQGTRKLLVRGGLNPTLHNAELEGGPRNGVMTALDDFMAEYPEPLRLVLIPVYFGLAIVVEQRRVDLTPGLGRAIDHLESAECRYALMKLTEDLRLRAMLVQHNLFYGRRDALERSRAKHLGLVKDALLDRHYLENEVRIAHLVSHVKSGSRINQEHLRDPARHEAAVYARLLSQRFGPSGPDGDAVSSFVPYTASGRVRLDQLERCLDAVQTEQIDGDLAECGTGRGGGAIFMRAYLDAHELPDRQVWVADRFRASSEPATETELTADGVAAFRADLNLVRDGFERFDLLDDRVRFLVGPLAESLSGAPIDQLALLRIGSGTASEIRPALDALYDKLADGGFVIVEEHATFDTMGEVEAFRADRGITAPIERVDAGSISWRRQSSEAKVGVTSEAGIPEPPPSIPHSDAPPLELTVVVVLHNMRREAERTLHSLSRAYQEGIEGIEYEVLVIDNGSSADQLLGATFVERFGPEFRYVEMGVDASPSPVEALNRGIADARGANVALMIDGAHVLTPGVLRFGLAGLRTYEPAVVATQQWYVGPGQQGDAIDGGYHTEYEDRLFETIGWPYDGYRLFEIGHFIGDRDWFDGIWESNCIFVPRSLLEQFGGYDATFSMPGGGYANLDLFERVGSSPGVAIVAIIGEGSFHQVHGGTSTNQADANTRRERVFGYGRHYAEQRGRAFSAPEPIHYVGWMPSPTVRRTKARRRTPEAFAAAGVLVDGDGPPETPVPVPDDLKTAFTEAVWRTMPWERTTWLGRRIRSAPTDLLAYQEAISSLRPDWIIETGTGDGGRTLFLASICELIDHGQVLSVDDAASDDRPQHPRIRYMKANVHSKDGIRRVQEVVGTEASVLVVLGAQLNMFKTCAQFERLAPLVSPGSYVIVTDTVVNGHPVWPAFGTGPAEAVKRILGSHGEFVADPRMEKYSLTFNPGGFLKRVK